MPADSMLTSELRPQPRGLVWARIAALLLVAASFSGQGMAAAVAAVPSSRASNSHWASGHYGLMSHFLPYAASIADYNKIVDAFDVQGYADDIAQSGATYVIFTLGQQGYFCAPNRTLDELCGPVTSRRDLIGEVAAALAKRGIRTIAYIPSGAPAPMAVGTRYLDEDSGGPGRRRDFQLNWQRAIAEYSRRWGDRISGWWIDGIYDGQKMYAFPDAPNYRSLADACRAGNPHSLVAFNTGEGPYSNPSEYGDWAAGEIHRHRQSLLECEGRWVTGVDPVSGHPFRLLWNLHTFLGHEFVGNGFGGPNDTPRFSDAYLTGFVRRVMEHGGTCQFDVPLHMGGPTDPDPAAEGHLGAAFLPQLRRLAKIVRPSPPVRDHGPNVALRAPARTDLPDAIPAGFGDDGNVHTIFRSGSDGVAVPWWQIDLGASRQIVAVQLVMDPSSADKASHTEMQVQASDDPDFKTFDVIAWTMEGTEIPSDGDFYTFLTTPVRYRYVRISRPAQSYHVFWWKPALDFSECRVFGPQ